MSLLRWLSKQLLGPEDEPPPAPDQLVTVATANGDGLAGLWQSTLEPRGIRCVLKRVSVVFYEMPAYEVQVQYKDLQRARQLLGIDDEDGETTAQD